MRIVIKKVDQKPVVKVVSGELKELQEIVGGHIECIDVGDNILCVCNEEGKLLGLRPNFIARTNIICGDVFFCSKGYEDFESLTDSQIVKLLNTFRY